MEFTGIAQEVRVWGALNDLSGDAYRQLWDSLEYAFKPLHLPGGAVKKITEGSNEDTEKRYIIFERVDGSKIYRIDSEVEDSWDRDTVVYAPYEVVAKEVTEIRYTMV
jgi:hypothetical protein